MTPLVFHLPGNGLDRSLHLAVFVGLAAVTFLAETLGWMESGLVVPGYLAMIVAAAPATGLFLLGEALATHGLVVTAGCLIPRYAHAWSAAFGRDRFYLYLVAAVLVRSLVEGIMVPSVEQRYAAVHSPELHSIGLVLVPLVANTLGASGVRYALPRLLALIGLVYVVLEFVLFRGSNYTISHFLLSAERPDVKFYESPKAHIILLLGAGLATATARRYGWEYGGIVVPAILAVTWYQPSRVLATLGEATILYLIVRRLAAVPAISSLNLVGPRRLLLVFGVGLCLKFLAGYGLERWAPEASLTDHLGFGYLLPSLLAASMLTHGRPVAALVSTLTTSVAGFVLGNLVGFSLTSLDPRPAVAASAPFSLEEDDGHPAFALLLADHAPSELIGGGSESAREYEQSAQAAGQLLAALAAKRVPTAAIAEATGADPSRSSLRVSRHTQGWYVAAGRATLPDSPLRWPRVAIRDKASSGAPWLVVVRSDHTASPLLFAAFRAAEALRARAIVVVSQHDGLRGKDEAFVELAQARLGTSRRFVVEGSDEATSLLRVYGRAASADLAKLRAAFGVDPSVLDSRAGDPIATSTADSVRLLVPRSLAESVALAEMGAEDVEAWPHPVLLEIRDRLPTLIRPFNPTARAPSTEELRVFSSVLARPALVDDPLQPPTPWQRAVARGLSFRYVRIGGNDERPEAWALVEAAAGSRRGNPVWLLSNFRRETRPLPVLVEVPVPGWEVGTLAAGLSLLKALPGRGLLISGTLPSGEGPDPQTDPRRRTAAKSYFQRIHEVWLGARTEHTALSVQGLSAEHGEAQVVLSTGREISGPSSMPDWLGGVRSVFDASGISVGFDDGGQLASTLAGRFEPAMAYALRFAPDRFAIAWMRPELRSEFVVVDRDGRFDARAAKLGIPVTTADIAERAFQLAACSTRGAGAAGAAIADCPTDTQLDCDLQAAAAGVQRYAREKNPYDLTAATHAGGCHVELAREFERGPVWAMIAGRREVDLVPLDIERPHEAPQSFTQLPNARRAIAWGRSTLRIEVHP